MPVQVIPVVVVIGAAVLVVGCCGVVIHLKNKYERRVLQFIYAIIKQPIREGTPRPPPSVKSETGKYNNEQEQLILPVSTIKDMIENANGDEVSNQTKVENWVLDLPSEAPDGRTVATEELDSISLTSTTSGISSNSGLRRRRTTLCQLCGNIISTIGKITMDCGHKFHLDCVPKVQLKNRMCPKCRTDKCCGCGEQCTKNYLKLDCEHVYHFACRTQYELLMQTCSICHPETETYCDNSDDEVEYYNSCE